jgi:hypothetical protein
MAEGNGWQVRFEKWSYQVAARTYGAEWLDEQACIVQQILGPERKCVKQR